jgi:hypothetical protein
MIFEEFCVSPTVVERILMVQKMFVTSGTLFSIGDKRNSQVVDTWFSPETSCPQGDAGA